MTVAFVTGGGRGVGRVMAEALAGEDFAVCVAARTAAEVEETAAAIEAAGGRALALTVDATDGAAVEKALATAEERLGAIDVLVNNAGSARAIGPVWEVEPQEWWQDVESSLRSAFLCSRAVLPRMLERGSGRILNVSSSVALRPTPYISGYAAAKAALLSLTEALAASVDGTGVRVFALTPGRFRSELMRHLIDSEAGRRWLPGIGDGGRWVEPERVARLVIFLATGAADQLQGRFLHPLDDLGEFVERSDELGAPVDLERDTARERSQLSCRRPLDPL